MIINVILYPLNIVCFLPKYLSFIESCFITSIIYLLNTIMCFAHWVMSPYIVVICINYCLMIIFKIFHALFIHHECRNRYHHIILLPSCGNEVRFHCSVGFNKRQANGATIIFIELLFFWYHQSLSLYYFWWSISIISIIHFFCLLCCCVYIITKNILCRWTNHRISLLIISFVRLLLFI